MGLKIRTVFLYVSISITFYILIHYFLLTSSEYRFRAFNHHNINFIPNLIVNEHSPNEAEKPLFYDAQSLIETTGFDDVSNATVGVKFHADDVITPVSTQVKEDDDYDANVNSLNDDVSSLSIFTKIHADDVSSISNSTDFDEHDDVMSPVIRRFNDHAYHDDVINTASTQGHDHADVTSPVSSQYNVSADVINSTRTEISEHDDVSNSVSTGLNDHDDVIRFTNVSILFPAWEALVIVSSDIENNRKNNNESVYCLFDTNEVSVAKYSGTISFNRKTYTCHLPNRVRRRLPFRQPVLVDTLDHKQVVLNAPELLRWNYIVYDVIDNENDEEKDVVLFAKGINCRQGVNRSPDEFKCVFGEDVVSGVVTDVTSSLQEVFRCKRPDLGALSGNVVKVSLLVVQGNHLVPSVAYYAPRGKVVRDGEKKLLCACTMVYNVAKFLKEWVVYHSSIGVEKFVLYDNGSDDDLREVVKVLRERGYDVEVRFWLWPKTQEAGFSHAALLGKGSCKWMMFIDVDEFVYSSLWKMSKPSETLLPALLPGSPYGQLMVRCFEFGPSGQKKHPLTGVTQGYNCRKEIENRHKSIVLLDAVHESLLNMIHHFKLKEGFRSKKVELGSVAVNHYKYQAWPEFKAKFKRRVSAYVADWTRPVNLKSNDRAPGLGYLAVKPEDWEDRFCEVYDNRLRDLTRRWFKRRNGKSGQSLDWQN